MFTLTTGSFRDLESAFVTDFIASRSADLLAPRLVIVPSGAVRTRLQQQLLKQLGPSAGILNTLIVDFYGLARRVLSTAPVHPETVVTEPALYEEIIRDLLQGAGEFPLELRSELHRPDRPLLDGLPRALAGTLRDLRDAGARVTDSLKVALEGHLGEATDAAAPTLELYARLYATLRSRGLRSSADVLRWATDDLPESPLFKAQQAIFIYGFYDMTGVQLDLLLALVNHPQARLYFPYREGNTAYRFAERLLQDPALSVKRHASESRGAGEGEKNPLDIAPARPLSGSPTLEVWSCSGARDEVWATAKEILRSAEAGTPYGDMLVTARGLSGYGDSIVELFTSHHIPYSMNTEESVGSYPLMKAIRSLLTLDQEDYPAAALSDLLRSAYFRPPWPDPSVLERLISAAGIVRGWTSWKERLTVWSRRAPPKDFAQASAVARDLLSQLVPLEAALRAGKTPQMWSEHVQWARTTIDRWLALPRSATFRERTLWTSVSEALEQLAVLDRLGKPVSREHFLRVWEEKIERWKTAFTTGGNAGVQVMDVMTARGLSFSTVFLLGMNEKTFPRLIREDPFLSDAARSALAHALGCRLARKMDGYQEERLLFELIRDAAHDRLLISFQRSDEDGKILVPSLYLRGLATDPPRLVPRPPVEKWRAEDPALLTPKELSVLWNRDHADASTLYPNMGADADTYQTLCARQALLDEIKPALGVMDGCVGPTSSVQTQYTRGHSPASLNDLSECPFRYFAGKILQLPNDLLSVIEEGDLPKDTAGILIHRILEAFYRSAIDQPFSDLKTDEVRSLLQKSYERSFQDLHETGIDIYPLVWEAQRQVIWERVWNFVKRDWRELVESGFRPTLLEVEVEGTISVLAGELGGYPFHGRIDRIDTQETESGARYRVIDYKTGRPTPKDATGEKMVLKGRYPQLPIYLGLTEQWLAKKLKKPVTGEGAFFYNLGDLELGRESPALGADFWQTTGGVYAENLAAWLRLAQKGIFYIRPSDERGYCHWCAFSTLCRKEHRPSAWRSEHSRERQSIEEKIKADGSPKKLGH